VLGARWPEHHHPAAAPGCFFLPRGPSRRRACVRPCVHAAPPPSTPPPQPPPPPLPSQCPPQIQSCDRIPSWPGPLPCLACSAWRRTDLHAKYTAVMRAIAAPAFRHEEGIIVSWLAVANLVRALFWHGSALLRLSFAPSLPSRAEVRSLFRLVVVAADLLLVRMQLFALGHARYGSQRAQRQR